MELKQYQKDVIREIRDFASLLGNGKSVAENFQSYWDAKGVDISKHDSTSFHSYKDTVTGVPRVTVKVPTAGGKTFIACNALAPLTEKLQSVRPKVIAWFVPSDAILTQTYSNLNNPDHDYRRKLDAIFGNNVVVLDKKDALNGKDLEPTQLIEQTTIFVLSVQSFATNDKEGRLSYRENGALAQYEKHIEDKIRIEDADKTSLIQVLAYLNPIVIIDESHNFRADLRVDMLKAINPCFILELSATPRENSNIISFVDANKLKKENMVKLPVVVFNHKSTNDVICSAIQLQKRLEQKAKTLYDNGGKYIRPIVLFQAQPNVDEESYNFEKIRKDLINCGIPENQIKIKTAKIDELKGIDLMSKDCDIRYIITVNALKEGWDCPFAYILASLANRTSKVDVEQIVGRILRLPYTTKHNDSLLNISYVFTSSSDFNETIRAVVESLNNAGYSNKDYRIGYDKKNEEENKPAEDTTYYSENLFGNEFEETPTEINNNITSEDIEINPKEICEALSSDNAEQAINIDKIEEEAEALSQEYDEQINLSETDSNTLSSEVMAVNPGYRIKDIFREDADKIGIPYFVRVVENKSIFSDENISNEEYVSLEKESLEEGFAKILPTLDCNINYTVTEVEGVKVDIDKLGNDDYRAQRFSLKEKELELLRASFETIPTEGRKGVLIKAIAKQLNYNSIPQPALINYIERSMAGMSNDKISQIIDNQLNAREAVKAKIDSLLVEYRYKQFTKLIDTGKIQLHSAYTYHFQEPLLITKKLIGIIKGLYTDEQDVNGFEYEVINAVANLDSVKFWHRNRDRVDFGIKGYVHHYPDFIVMMNSGTIVLIETKGDHLKNEDSRYKLEIGKTWANKCEKFERTFRYFMVFKDEPIEGAITFKELIERLKEM